MIDPNKLPIFADAFNLLCGERLGGGIHRDVFVCKLRSDLVVKVETDIDLRNFANVREMQFWCDNQHASAIAKWLAPCEFLSPDGRILLQQRVRPIVPIEYDKLPQKLPAFITDRKYANFGWTAAGQLVACDYGLTINSPSTRMTKSEFWE